MPTLTVTKTYQDGNVLTEADLDNIKNSLETFFNTTKIDDDNIQDAGISKSKLTSAAQEFLVPTGAMIDWTTTSAPSGWLLCGGQAVSRTTYSALFAVIGTTYGVGDGSTTFNVPDARGRVTAGLDNMNSDAGRLTSGGSGVDGDTIATGGGTETHTLTTAELSAHTHGAGSYSAVGAGDHNHLLVNSGSSGSALSGSNFISETDSSTYTLTGNSGGTDKALSQTAGAHTHTISGTGGSTGSGNAHNNVQPTLVVAKIIKT